MTTRFSFILGTLAALTLSAGCNAPSQNSLTSWLSGEENRTPAALPSAPPEQVAQVEIQTSLAPLNQTPTYQLTDSDIGELTAESLLTEEERADLEKLKAQN